MTLRERLTATYIAVTLIGLLLASSVGALLVRNAQLRSADRTVRLITNVVRSGVVTDGAGMAPDDPALLRLTAAAGARLLHIGPDGVVISDSGDTMVGNQLRSRLELLAEPGGEGRRAIRQARVGGQSYFFSSLPAPSTSDGGWLLIAIPTTTLLDSWMLMLPAMLLLSALGVAVAGGAGWAISRKLSAPLEAMTVAANQMAQGDYESRVETTEDVGEMKSLAEAFNTMASEVMLARQTQRDFLANVSHDLRTPLTSIQGFSQALMDGAVPAGQTTRVAGIIHTEAARLTRLVQDLLDLARIEAGRFSMVQRDINVKAILERCEEKFRAQAETMGIEFACDVPRRALPVHGDADRLEQVITNLVDNALTYAQDGGGHVRLSGALGGIRGSGPAKGEENGHAVGNGNGNGHGEDLTRKLGRWWIEINVEDDGPGIAEEQRPLVFERFHRGDRARGGTGMGLGLAIAREIVEAHGGNIAIEDAESRGTRFVVRLPMKMR